MCFFNPSFLGGLRWDRQPGQPGKSWVTAVSFSPEKCSRGHLSLPSPRPVKIPTPWTKGLSSKRCPGIRILSRADREIGVFWNAAPHTRLRREFPRETGLMVRCPWKVGKAFQTKQVNRPYCRDQEGRRGSDEVVPGTSVFPSRETGMSGSFWGLMKLAKYCFKLQDETWDFS